jgi:LDH2 family malate/lactate/ureidoglycolate dehydrogenase
VIRIPAYLRSIEEGRLVADARPEVVKELPGTAVVDAKRGFGQVAASFALDVAIEKATTVGIGAASVRNCNHIGRLGDYGEAAAARGFIAIITYGSSGPNSGHAAPFGGSARHLGTNPLSVGIPGGEGDPVVVDFATTMVAEGKIQVARAKHVPLPPGCIVDKEGQPSTNAEDFYAGGMILPVGGHKGYGLSLVTALLGAGLTAEQPPQGGRGGGVFVVAVNPQAFTDGAVYGQTVDALTGAVKAVPPAPGFSEVMLPGGPEAKSRAEREAQGVPVPADTWAALTEVAGRLNVPLPESKTA